MIDAQYCGRREGKEAGGRQMLRYHIAKKGEETEETKRSFSD